MAEGSVRIDKKDQSKAPLGLLASVLKELGDVAKVMAFGNIKYKSVWNYQTIDRGHERFVDAGLRHAYADAAGEVLDPESGQFHLAHAACCFLMALWFRKNRASEATSVRPGVWQEPDESDAGCGAV